MGISKGLAIIDSTSVDFDRSDAQVLVGGGGCKDTQHVGQLKDIGKDLRLWASAKQNGSLKFWLEMRQWRWRLQRLHFAILRPLHCAEWLWRFGVLLEQISCF